MTDQVVQQVIRCSVFLLFSVPTLIGIAVLVVAAMRGRPKREDVEAAGVVCTVIGLPAAVITGVQLYDLLIALCAPGLVK